MLALRWPHRQESNLYLALRRRPFYPLNYGESRRDSGTHRMAGMGRVHCQRQLQITSIELESPDCARMVKRCATR